ncbi:hypothetical protein Y032_0827g2553 [Ancylostoma ceylanicum]|uniref:RRM domain-containing protein n=1 Tax=Ancylostoma ceylanicum TaxID=53326 RepID=A0A016WBY7_9BILA|nr:hypothetical protein Y032_0827g2553 [Ancylostoma ceylanicum]
MWHPAPPSLATVGGASRRTPSPAAAEANIGDRRRQCWRWAIANFGDQHFHVFVGDLSPEVDNAILKEAFAVHGEVSEAKVIRDSQTQKSKGYGFVSYPSKENAEKAIASMNGHWLGRRAIRTNWATRRPSDEAREKLTFEQVFNSTKPDNTSVYVGNVNPNTTENDLREPFSVHGEITEVRLFKAQGYAFVRYERKECATNAIMDMNGKEIGGNTIRCSWGRMQQVTNPGPNKTLMPLNKVDYCASMRFGRGNLSMECVVQLPAVTIYRSS